MKKLSTPFIGMLLLSVILILSGCASIVPNYGSVFSSDGNVSISLPSGWNTNDPTIKKILPASVIGASDTANQEYMAVVGVPKSYVGSNSTINDFFAQIKTGSVAIAASGVWGTPSAITIDGLNALTVQFTGIYRQNKTNSTFLVNIVENTNYYYALIAFTDTTLVSTNEATLQTIISSFKAPAKTVSGGWKPYTFPGSVVVFFILLIIGISLIILGRRLRNKVRVTHPSKGLKIAIIVVWILLISTYLFLVAKAMLAKLAAGAAAGQTGPIFPITLACAAAAFICVAYISRRDGIWPALGNGFVAAATGPMVFEFPFDLLVIPQINAPASFLIRYFGPLDIAVLATLSLILLSRRVYITRRSMYALGAMFAVWAVWAWFGFSYPSTPISFTLNAISKVLSFMTVAALFSTEPKQVTFGDINKSS